MDQVEHVRHAFLRFVEDNSECLCPLILYNRMIVELPTAQSTDANIVCQIETSGEGNDGKYIAVRSSMILHNLLSVKVEVVAATDSLFAQLAHSRSTRLDAIKSEARLFRLDTLHCKLVLFSIFDERTLSHFQRVFVFFN